MSDDIPRYGGLPLEEYEQPDWYEVPQGFAFVDDFGFPDDGTLSISLIRHASTGRLVLDIRHGEEWQHHLRLPLDVPAGVTSFGLLAKALDGEVAGYEPKVA